MSQPAKTLRETSTEEQNTPEARDQRQQSESRVRAAAPVADKPRRPRGFAAMDPKKVSEIASKGGKAAHAAGTAHQFTSDEARSAGHKGGVAPHVRRGRGPRQDKPEDGPTGGDTST